MFYYMPLEIQLVKYVSSFTSAFTGIKQWMPRAQPPARGHPVGGGGWSEVFKWLVYSIACTEQTLRNAKNVNWEKLLLNRDQIALSELHTLTLLYPSRLQTKRDHHVFFFSSNFFHRFPVPGDG